MRTSGIRLVRKLIGYVLLVVNLMLSIVSAVAVYSVIEFAGNEKNYHFDDRTSPAFNLTASVPFIYIGDVVFNNTGLFDFNNFTIDFELTNETTSTTLLHYHGSFGDIKAGQKRTLSLNLTTIPGNSTLYIMPSLPPIPWSNSTIYGGYLQLSGKYVLSLFAFSFNITNIAGWTSIPILLP
jgi:hypothetical protein